MTDRILIVGAGIGGMSAALSLQRAGFAVELVDVDPDWRVYGAGITLLGLSLRAFSDLGVLPAIRERGYVTAGLRLCKVSGEVLMSLPPPPDPPPISSSGGILRSVLHDILARQIRAQGIPVKLGVTVSLLAMAAGGVDVQLTDGTAGRYALVVGADGIGSAIRQMAFPEAPRPRFTGQGCWRVVAPRPASLATPVMYLGGKVKVGLVPISQSQMYAFILEHVPHNPRYEPAAQLPHLRGLLQEFGGEVAQVREGLDDGSLINYRPLEWVLVPAPWFNGRVVLIGDAAHATTPHLASGAGLAVEDGLVLAQELGRAAGIDPALKAFMARRFERARMVVESSVRIGEQEMAAANPMLANQAAAAAMQLMEAPY